MDSEQLEQLIKELMDKPDKINELDDETVKEVSKKISVYGKVDFVPKNDYCCLSITNLRDEYLKHMSMLSLCGFVYKMLDEYQAVEDDEKKPIKDFLDSLFEFNPDYHAKKSDDPCNVPLDTLHRWKNYEDVNYEKYRELTENVYKYRADLDYVVNVYDCFETLEDAKNFQKLHQDQFIHDVVTVKNNNWVYMGSFKENREKVDFYNKNTEILEEILTRVESDKKVGSELLKKRMVNTKRRNIRKYGKPSDKIESVFNAAVKDADKLIDEKSAQDLCKVDDPYLPRGWDPKPPETMGEMLVRDQGEQCPENAVQVDTWINDGGNLRHDKIYSECVVPELPKK